MADEAGSIEEPFHVGKLRRQDSMTQLSTGQVGYGLEADSWGTERGCASVGPERRLPGLFG